MDETHLLSLSFGEKSPFTLYLKGYWAAGGGDRHGSSVALDSFTSVLTLLGVGKMVKVLLRDRTTPGCCY